MHKPSLDDKSDLRLWKSYRLIDFFDIPIANILKVGVEATCNLAQCRTATDIHRVS